MQRDHEQAVPAVRKGTVAVTAVIAVWKWSSRPQAHTHHVLVQCTPEGVREAARQGGAQPIVRGGGGGSKGAGVRRGKGGCWSIETGGGRAQGQGGRRVMAGKQWGAHEVALTYMTRVAAEKCARG
jgi:hypothetical protein